MRINHNIAALNTYNKLTANTAATSKSLEKLSSGLKINKAGDNAAGLAISEKMRGQIRGLDQASTNASDAISLINTAEGALSETHSILQRMRELAVQSSNDTNVTIDREEIQKEMNQLTSEINRIGNTTEFNTQKLLDGGGSTITGRTVGTVTAGGAAGQISSVDTVTTSNTGKSLASFTAGSFTVSVQGNDTTTDLAGKNIIFTAGAAAGSETVTVSGDDITVDINAGSSLTQIQTALNNSSAFGGGGVTLSVTETATGTVQSGATLVSAAGTAAVWATNSDVGFSAASTSSVSRGTYSFDVSQAFVADGDKFNLKLANGLSPNGWAEISLTATENGADASTGALTGTFDIGADATERYTAEEQAAHIVAALKENTSWDLDAGAGTKRITDVYDISASGSKIIFTEKSALGPQASIKDGAFSLTHAVASENTYNHVGQEMVEVGGSFIIDDVEIKVVDGTGETDAVDVAAGTAILRNSSEGNTNLTQIDLLSEAINRNAELNTKYAATDNNAGLLTLEQKSGNESSTIPVMEVSNKAGQKFQANFQIGANTAQSMTIEVNDMRAAALKISGTTSGETVTAKDGVTTASYVTSTEKNVTDGTTNTGTEYSLDVSTHEKATAAISVINDAIESVSAERSKLGSYQNRLEHTINNLGTSSENLTTAESRIRDVDMAKEMMEFTKNNILSQAAQSMLAQANQQPQGVLQLLQ